jgi:hypothetical protein
MAVRIRQDFGFFFGGIRNHILRTVESDVPCLTVAERPEAPGYRPPQCVIGMSTIVRRPGAAA